MKKKKKLKRERTKHWRDERHRRLFRPCTSITEKYGCYLTAFQSRLHTLLTLFRDGGRRRSIDSIKTSPPAGHVRPSRLFWTFQRLRHGFQKTSTVPGSSSVSRWRRGVTMARRVAGSGKSVYTLPDVVFTAENRLGEHVQIGLSNGLSCRIIRRITRPCFWIWRTRRVWHRRANLARQAEFVLSRSWKSGYDFSHCGTGASVQYLM